jgi:hypothetical protein
MSPALHLDRGLNIIDCVFIFYLLANGLRFSQDSDAKDQSLRSPYLKLYIFLVLTFALWYKLSCKVSSQDYLLKKP